MVYIKKEYKIHKYRKIYSIFSKEKNSFYHYKFIKYIHKMKIKTLSFN